MFTIVQFVNGVINTLPVQHNWNIAFDTAINLEFQSNQVNILERRWDLNISKMTTTVYFVKNKSIFRNDNKLLPVYSHKKEFELAKEFKNRLMKMWNDINDLYKKFSRESPYLQDEYHGLTVLEMFYKYEQFLNDDLITSIRENIFDKLSDLNAIIISLNIEKPIDASQAKTFDIVELDNVCRFIENKVQSTKSWLVFNCY